MTLDKRQERRLRRRLARIAKCPPRCRLPQPHWHDEIADWSDR